MTNKEKDFYEFGPFRMDLSQRLLLRDNQPVPLQPKAFDTLLTLVRNSEKVVLKEDLMKSVWPDAFVEESNLTQAIFVLRKALEEIPGERRYIVTVPGRGYRFAEKVRRLADPGVTQEAVTQEDAAQDRAIAVETSAPVRGVRRKAIVAATVVILALAFVAYRYFPRRLKLTDKSTIVVADFANITGDPVFDGALRQGLSAQLDQSPYLNLLSDQRIAQTLSLMAQPKDTQLLPRCRARFASARGARQY